MSVGKTVSPPLEVRHTDSELSELARLLKSLDGKTRVVMEYRQLPFAGSSLYNVGSFRGQCHAGARLWQ